MLDPRKTFGGLLLGLAVGAGLPSYAIAQSELELDPLEFDYTPGRAYDPERGARMARQRESDVEQRAADAAAQLELVRVSYDSVGGYLESYYVAYGREWQRWETDFPEAELNFSRRLRELTRLRVARKPRSLRFTDPEIFERPFLYMSDVGWMKLSDEEVERFREYLRKGGFVWVDDFWGDAEWNNFERIMRRVLPTSSWRDVPLDHPLLHIAFDVDAIPQIPAREFALSGMTSEPPSFHRDPAGNLEGAHLRGYFDGDGQLMVVATHNTDIGDGFEREAYGQWYFETHSTRAYALGINIILYALSH